MRGHIQFPVFQKKNISTDDICHRCFVCWTVRVFINVFWVVNFCISFSLLSDQSHNNRWQWFSNVAQVILFIILV